MKYVHIFGIGEYADVARYHFGPRVINFITSEKYRANNHLDLPVLQWETLSPSHPLFIAVGNNQARAEIYKAAKDRDFQLVDLISPDANIRHAEYGEHCCILEYNNVQPFVEIGNNCILWSGNHLGHHSKIGNHCFITSHVVISGGVEVGDYTFIGVNATIGDHIRIGRGCIVQAGAVVDRDVPDDSVWTREGLSKVPAHKIKL